MVAHFLKLWAQAYVDIWVVFSKGYILELTLETVLELRNLTLKYSYKGQF